MTPQDETRRPAAPDTLREAGTALKHRWQGWQARARALGDERLEKLLEDRAGASPEVEEVLAGRRHEREQQQARLQAREHLLAQAGTPTERRILLRVAERTDWAGGQGEPLRYTELLDTLIHGGDPAQEMLVHRSLWTLAERRVLHVSGHGEITAVEP